MTHQPKTVIRVALVDFQTIFRAGLRALIGHEAGLEVVADTPSVQAMEELDVDPDVVVTALAFPDIGIDDIMERFRRRFRDASVLALTAFDDLATVQRALAAGANGYVLKSAATTDLFAGIRAVAGGGLYLQLSIGIAFVSQSPQELLHSAVNPLTSTETEVLKLLALGHTNVEIATLTNSSLRTIETHRAHIHQKARQPYPSGARPLRARHRSAPGRRRARPGAGRRRLVNSAVVAAAPPVDAHVRVAFVA